MAQLNQKLQDLWKKEKEISLASRKNLRKELTQKIENEILKMFTELDICEDSEKILIYALPYEVPDTTDKNFAFMIKLIFQEFNDKTKKDLIQTTVKKIRINLDKEAFKVVGPTCCKVNPEDIYIAVLPLYIYYSMNNCIDLTKEVISPLLQEINPLALCN